MMATQSRTQSRSRSWRGRGRGADQETKRSSTTTRCFWAAVALLLLVQTHHGTNMPIADDPTASAHGQALSTSRHRLQDGPCHVRRNDFPVGNDVTCHDHTPLCVPVGDCGTDETGLCPEPQSCRHIEFWHFNSTVDAANSLATVRFQLWDVTNDTPIPDLPACKFEVLTGRNPLRPISG
jgi:hypothetical protein